MRQFSFHIVPSALNGTVRTLLFSKTYLLFTKPVVKLCRINTCYVEKDIQYVCVYISLPLLLTEYPTRTAPIALRWLFLKGPLIQLPFMPSVALCMNGPFLLLGAS